MRITVTGPVSKLCPFKDEVDHGTVELTFDAAEAPELHALAAALQAHDRKITHEAYTAEVYEAWEPHGCVSVTSSWTTAGLSVTCAVPRN